MKVYTILLAVALLYMASCGQRNTTDEQTPGTSGSKIDPPNAEAASGATDQRNMAGQGSDTATAAGASAGNTDSAAVRFLLKAADGGMAEVESGKLAQRSAQDASVKRFAQMMVSDHSGANEQVKKLSRQRNIKLPAELTPEHKSAVQSIANRKGNNFDETYMEMMVNDHRKTIDLFERSAKDTKDKEVADFIQQTLPKLRIHLDSAVAIQRRVKKGAQ